MNTRHMNIIRHGHFYLGRVSAFIVACCLFFSLYGKCEDWSVAVFNSTSAQFPDPAKFGNWDYPHSLYLYGVYETYKRTGDRRYLDYIEGWANSHVSEDGNVDHDMEALDDWLGGNVLVALWNETRDPRYRHAAERIRRRIDSYPRLPDGSLWHAVKWRDQVWADGLYMSMPFLVRYGDAFNDETYARAEAVRQMTLSKSHLRDEKTGLYRHAYDATGQSEWADPAGHRSKVFWGRAIGWYSMALVDILEHLPRNSKQHKALVRQFRDLMTALVRYQDQQTGLWYQVVDRSDLQGNWLETSCSSMYVYAMFKGLQHHYLGREFLAAADKGYAGVLTRITRDADGTVRLSGICEGTNVGGLDFYLHRKSNTNDLHGVGAFLLMNEAAFSYREGVHAKHSAIASSHGGRKTAVRNPAGGGR